MITRRISLKKTTVILILAFIINITFASYPLGITTPSFESERLAVFNEGLGYLITKYYAEKGNKSVEIFDLRKCVEEDSAYVFKLGGNEKIAEFAAKVEVENDHGTQIKVIFLEYIQYSLAKSLFVYEHGAIGQVKEAVSQNEINLFENNYRTLYDYKRCNSLQDYSSATHDYFYREFGNGEPFMKFEDGIFYLTRISRTYWDKWKHYLEYYPDDWVHGIQHHTVGYLAEDGYKYVEVVEVRTVRHDGEGYYISYKDLREDVKKRAYDLRRKPVEAPYAVKLKVLGSEEPVIVCAIQQRLLGDLPGQPSFFVCKIVSDEDIFKNQYAPQYITDENFTHVFDCKYNFVIYQEEFGYNPVKYTLFWY